MISFHRMSNSAELLEQTASAIVNLDFLDFLNKKGYSQPTKSYMRWEKSHSFFQIVQEMLNTIFRVIKVSKSRKQNIKSRILPKNERNSLVCFIHFCGRISDTIICFRDLLTFSTMCQKYIRRSMYYQHYVIAFPQNSGTDSNGNL